MKKRRTLIITCLIIASLALGIGYAGFTSELSIGGEAILGGVSESQVIIETIEITDSTGPHITASVNGEGTKAATVDVSGFAEPDEYAVLTVTVSNPHPFAVTMSAPNLVISDATNTITGGGTYFDIELVDPASIPTTINADSTVTFQIRVAANVITADAHTTNFTVTFSASTRT